MDGRADFSPLDRGRLYPAAAVLTPAGYLDAQSSTATGLLHPGLPDMIGRSAPPPVPSPGGLGSPYAQYHSRCASNSLAVNSGGTYPSFLSGVYAAGSMPGSPAASPFRAPPSGLSTMRHLWPPVPPPPDAYSRCGMNASLYSLFSMVSGNEAPPYYSQSIMSRLTSSQSPYSHLCDSSKDIMYPPMIPPPPPTHVTSTSSASLDCANSLAQMEYFTKRLDTPAFCPTTTDFWRPDTAGISTRPTTEHVSSNSNNIRRKREHSRHVKRSTDNLEVKCEVESSTGVGECRKEKGLKVEEKWGKGNVEPTASVTTIGTVTVTTTTITQTVTSTNTVSSTSRCHMRSRAKDGVCTISSTSSSNNNELTALDYSKKNGLSELQNGSIPFTPIVEQQQNVPINYSNWHTTPNTDNNNNNSAFAVVDNHHWVDKQNSTTAVVKKELPSSTYPCENWKIQKPHNVDKKSTKKTLSKINTNHSQHQRGVIKSTNDQLVTPNQQFVFEWAPPSNSQLSPSSSYLIQRNGGNEVSAKTVIATIRSSPNSGQAEAPILHIPSPACCSTSPAVEEDVVGEPQSAPLSLVVSEVDEDGKGVIVSEQEQNGRQERLTPGQNPPTASFHIPVGIAVGRQRHEPSPSHVTVKQRTEDSKEQTWPNSHHIQRGFARDSKDVFLSCSKQMRVSPTTSTDVVTTDHPTPSNSQWEEAARNGATNFAPPPPPPPPPPWMAASHNSTYWVPQTPYATTAIPLSMQIGTTFDPTHLPIPPVGYQLARDSITGHLLLIPTNIDIMDRNVGWPTSYNTSTPHLQTNPPMQQFMVQQQILQQERSLEYRLTLPSQFTTKDPQTPQMPEDNPQIPAINNMDDETRIVHVDERKNIDGKEKISTNSTSQSIITSIPIASGSQPFSYGFSTTPGLPYFYDGVVQLAQAVQTDTGRRSQGTSPVVMDECCSMPSVEDQIGDDGDTCESGRVGVVDEDQLQMQPQVADASNQTETPPLTEEEEEEEMIVEVEKKDVGVQENSNFSYNAVGDEALSTLEGEKENLVSDFHGLELLSNSVVELEGNLCDKPNSTTNVDEKSTDCENNVDVDVDVKFHPEIEKALRLMAASASSTTRSTAPEVPENMKGLAGLGLLCALAEQKFLEEKFTSTNGRKKVSNSTTSESKRVNINRRYKKSQKDIKNLIANRMLNFDGNIGPSTAEQLMDATELEMRLRLADLQRRYKEKQKELAKLQPKRDKDEFVDKSPTKRGPGRPRKRKFSGTLSTSKKKQPTLDNLVKTLVKLEASPPLLETVLDEPPRKKKKKKSTRDCEDDKAWGVTKLTTPSHRERLDYAKKPILKPALLKTNKLVCRTLSTSSKGDGGDVRVKGFGSGEVKEEVRCPVKVHIVNVAKGLKSEKSSTYVSPSLEKEFYWKASSPKLFSESHSSSKNRDANGNKIGKLKKLSKKLKNSHSSPDHKSESKISVNATTGFVGKERKSFDEVNGLGLLAQYASQVVEQSSTSEKRKRKENDVDKMEEPSSKVVALSPTNVNSSKKRKPGRPKKHSTSKSKDTTEMLVSKKSKHVNCVVSSSLSTKEKDKEKTKKSKSSSKILTLSTNTTSTITTPTTTTPTSTITTTSTTSTITTTTSSSSSSKAFYLEDEAWNRRRSERIFLNDLNVTPSGGYSDTHSRHVLSPPQLKPATDESPTWKTTTKSDENTKPPKNLTRAPDSSTKNPSVGLNNISSNNNNNVVVNNNNNNNNIINKKKNKTETLDVEMSTLPASPIVSTSLSPKKKKKERHKRRDRSVSEELFQALKDKCCLSDVSAVGGCGLSPRDSDSDNVESSSYSEGETLPLSQLVERPATPEPRSAVISPDELTDKIRVLILMDGLFYAGHINAIQAPDVYGITLDGERGNRPHIYSREEILKEAFLEVKPESVRFLPENTRVCAYWSQQYRCLYPGTVAKSPSPNPSNDTSTVYVEFDDGDSGKIPLSDIRLLPATFPVVSYDPSPLVYLGKRRSRSATESSTENRNSTNFIINNNNTNHVTNNNNIVSPVKSKKSRTKNKDSRGMSPFDKSNTSATNVISNGKRDENGDVKPKKSKKTKNENKSRDHRDGEKSKKNNSTTNDDELSTSSSRNSSSSSSKKHKKHRDDHKHHHHHHHHHKRKHKHDKKHVGEKENKSNSNIDNCNKLVTSLPPPPPPPPLPPPVASGESKKSELMVKIKTNSSSTAVSASPAVVDGLEVSSSSVGEDSETRSTWDSSECSKFSSPSELDKDSSDDSSDEDYVVNSNGKKSKSKKEDTQKSKKRSERTPSSESKSKIAAFLPARQIWRWSGKSFKRPGTKGKAKKEFYKAITRGKETITVGDCAVFLSTGRPHLPYIGRIEMMWEAWGGNMVVKVTWFYHPEETKGGRRLTDLKGALYQSPHEDENDVQTISHKCEVLSWEQCKKRNERRQDGGQDADTSLFDNNDVYYLAGHYDPTTGIVQTEPGIC